MLELLRVNLSDDLASKAFKNQRKAVAFYKTVISPQAGEGWEARFSITNNILWLQNFKAFTGHPP